MSRRGSSTRIYIGNLPEDITQNEIDKIFHKFGRIREIDIKYARSNFGSTYAFLEYDDSRDAEEAVQSRNGYRFCGSNLRVEFTGDRRPKRNRNKSHGPPRRTSYRVIVTGLPLESSWQDLKDHMRKVGPVGYANIENRIGIVEYESREDMDRAIKKLDRSQFENIYDRCEIRVRLDKTSSSYRDRSYSRSYRHKYSRSRSRTYRRGHRHSPRSSERGHSRDDSRSRSGAMRHSHKNHSPHDNHKSISRSKSRTRSPLISKHRDSRSVSHYSSRRAPSHHSNRSLSHPSNHRSASDHSARNSGYRDDRNSNNRSMSHHSGDRMSDDQSRTKRAVSPHSGNHKYSNNRSNSERSYSNHRQSQQYSNHNSHSDRSVSNHSDSNRSASHRSTSNHSANYAHDSHDDQQSKANKSNGLKIESDPRNSSLMDSQEIPPREVSVGHDSNHS